MRRSQSRWAWEEAAPSAGPPLRDALPGLCPERRLRGTGRRPSPAALSRLSSGFSGTGAGHSAAIAQSPGKDDPATVRPKATTRLGFSNELGSRPHGKSEFRFSGAPTPDPLGLPPPILAEPRSATFPGSAFWHPDSASWWTPPLLGPREDLPLKQLREKLRVQNKDVVIAVESSLWALGGGRPLAPARLVFL